MKSIAGLESNAGKLPTAVFKMYLLCTRANSKKDESKVGLKDELLKSYSTYYILN